MKDDSAKLTIRLSQLAMVRLLQRCFNIKNIMTTFLIPLAQQISFIWSIEKHLVDSRKKEKKKQIIVGKIFAFH